MDLIERLSAATGPDRELDRAIAEDGLGMITEWLAPVNSPVMVLCFMPYRREGAQPPASAEVPAYTASLDAAITLIPADTVWHVMTDYGDLNRAKVGPVGKPSATVYRCNDRPPDVFEQADAETPALALCIAALKARQTAPA